MKLSETSTGNTPVAMYIDLQIVQTFAWPPHDESITAIAHHIVKEKD